MNGRFDLLQALYGRPFVAIDVLLEQGGIDTRYTGHLTGIQFGIFRKYPSYGVFRILRRIFVKKTIIRKVFVYIRPMDTEM